MNFYRNFLFCTYLMIFIGAFSLTFAEGSPFYLLTAVVFLTIAWSLAHSGRADILSPKTTVRLSFLSFVFLIIDWLIISQALPLAFAHFLLVIQIIKIFSIKKDRDYIQIYAISFIHLALASIMTIDLSFAISFMLYMIVSCWALTLFHLKRGAERHLLRRELTEVEKFAQPNTRNHYLRRIKFQPRPFFLASTASTLLTLVFTIMLFSIFPRSTSHFLYLKFRGDSQSLSGFSEQVSFGDINDIKLDTMPVMTVKYLDPPGYYPGLFIRGLTYTTYNGRSWSSDRTSTPVNCSSNALSFALRQNRRKFHYPDENSFSYRIIAEPGNTRVLFHIGPIYSASFTSGKPAGLIFHPVEESLLMGSPPKEEIRYVGESYDVPMDMAALQGKSAVINKDELHRLCTEIPNTGSEELIQLTNFAQQTFAEYDADTDYLKVKALESKLQTTFEYTLKSQPTPGIEPVYDFLFNMKKGHCEYFASAMVILCRIMDIPARLVGGYRGGYFNPMGEFYQVTQANAHAWVEVHFDGIGWVPFDPTPPDSLPEDSIWRMAQNFLEYLRYSWDEFVIDFGWHEQHKIFLFLRNKIEELKQTLRNLPQYLYLAKTWIWWLVKKYGYLLIAIIPVFFFISRRLLRFLAKKKLLWTLRKKVGATRILIEFFKDLLVLLERHGFNKTDFETPREFAFRVINIGGAAYTPVYTVVEKYYDTRFGDVELTSVDYALIQDILTEMRSITLTKK
ncbi:DUF3488 and DUF4129 domain-containing transglutaminase family protein [Planctomycetota bacterium]